MKSYVKLDCSSNYFGTRKNIIWDIEFEFEVDREWLSNWVRNNLDGGTLEYFIENYLWDDSVEVYEDARSEGVIANVFNIENTGILEELEYEEIKNYKQVYVEYDRSGSTWCEETMKHCIDGVEDVFLDENGIVYTVDKQGSKLTDLDHYIECEGIKVYSL